FLGCAFVMVTVALRFFPAFSHVESLMAEARTEVTKKSLDTLTRPEIDTLSVKLVNSFPAERMRKATKPLPPAAEEDKTKHPPAQLDRASAFRAFLKGSSDGTIENYLHRQDPTRSDLFRRNRSELKGKRLEIDARTDENVADQKGATPSVTIWPLL